MIDDDPILLESLEQLAVGYAAGEQTTDPVLPVKSPWRVHLSQLAIELAIAATALGAAELALR